MSKMPLMPKATAVWLVENTSLTFDQVADFCHLHELEVKGIADGDVAQGIKGMDPVTSGQLSRDEIERGQADPGYRLKLSEPKVAIPEVKTKRGPRYTPVSRRQDRPDAIWWLLRNHPELTDSQIMKLVGTTKPTIQAIRERSHWNSQNIKPVDPVTLGLCRQLELDAEVQKAALKLERAQKEKEKEAVEERKQQRAEKKRKREEEKAAAAPQRKLEQEQRKQESIQKQAAVLAAKRRCSECANCSVTWEEDEEREENSDGEDEGEWTKCTACDK